MSHAIPLTFPSCLHFWTRSSSLHLLKLHSFFFFQCNLALSPEYQVIFFLTRVFLTFEHDIANLLPTKVKSESHPNLLPLLPLLQCLPLPTCCTLKGTLIATAIVCPRSSLLYLDSLTLTLPLLPVQDSLFSSTLRKTFLKCHRLSYPINTCLPFLHWSCSYHDPTLETQLSLTPMWKNPLIMSRVSANPWSKAWGLGHLEEMQGLWMENPRCLYRSRGQTETVWDVSFTEYVKYIHGSSDVIVA